LPYGRSVAAASALSQVGVAVAKLKAYLINCSNNERHLKQTGADKKWRGDRNKMAMASLLSIRHAGRIMAETAPRMCIKIMRN